MGIYRSTYCEYLFIKNRNQRNERFTTTNHRSMQHELSSAFECPELEHTIHTNCSFYPKMYIPRIRIDNSGIAYHPQNGSFPQNIGTRIRSDNPGNVYYPQNDPFSPQSQRKWMSRNSESPFCNSIPRNFSYQKNKNLLGMSFSCYATVLR